MAAKTKRTNWKRLFIVPGVLLITLVMVLCLSLIFVAYKKESGTTDYSKSEHWLSLPSSPEKKVDVFYLYPTSYQKNSTNDPNICAIDNPSMLKIAKTNLVGQATAFEDVANIYAPYYRQVDARYVLSLPLEDQNKIIGDIPTSDAIAAFDYYIKNYNHDRPFILAGHSQGSNIMLYLLSDYMKKNPKVYKRMIAAYVIGYSVTKDYLAKNPHLKFAEGPDDTGVIISYNTEAPNVKGNNPVLLPGALAINPITWTRTEKPSLASESLGSFMPDEQGNFETIMNYADARVDTKRGVVICGTVDVEKLSPGNPVFGKGVYHMYDYQFYYFNIRKNAANRVDNFLNK
jgi:hypothetical protein